MGERGKKRLDPLETKLLVHHDLGLGLVGRLARLVLLLGVVAHLDVLIAITGLILVQLVIIVLTLLLEVLTTGVGDIIVVLTGSVLATLHLLVLTLVGFLELLDKGGLQLGLFRTVGVAIVLQAVGLRLVRGILCGCRLLGIPSRQTLVSFGCGANSAGEIKQTYHLIAKRVTRGFSARTLRRMRSMTGLAGGSVASSSESYSLLT